MKPLKIHINIAAQDCYIYAGYMFIVNNQGELIYVSLTKLVKKLFIYYPEYASFLRLIFLRNDYLHNTQGGYFFDVPSFKTTFNNAWKRFSKFNHIYLDIEDDDFTFIGKIPDLPIYDIRAYAMRLYVATKNGLYEIQLGLDGDGYTLNPSRIKKVFDGKTICINAKSGNVFASAANDGLFYGSFEDTTSLKIIERPIQAKSLRTGWSHFDIFNYSELNIFSYVKNEISNDQVTSRIAYSKFDERSEKKRFIERVGSKIFSMESLLGNSLQSDQISFCFNSGSNGFFYMNDGKFFVVNLIKDNRFQEESFHFSSRRKIMPSKFKKSSRPLSSQIIPNGCIVEFMDNISIFQNGQQIQIEDDFAQSMRSYISSIRYKNLVSIVKDEIITLYSIYPFIDSNISLLDDTYYSD